MLLENVGSPSARIFVSCTTVQELKGSVRKNAGRAKPNNALRKTVHFPCVPCMGNPIQKFRLEFDLRYEYVASNIEQRRDEFP